MDILDSSVKYQTIRIRHEDNICFIQIFRPEANNSINNKLIDEIYLALLECKNKYSVVVLEGLPDVFCFGADFREIGESFAESGTPPEQNAEKLYDVWRALTHGPYITIAHVKGKANAGGVGFVAACDIVLCEERTVFSLSELLFGLVPACVYPFLVKRIGVSKTNYLTLMTQPISALTACEWGLVDAFDQDSDNLLRKHLLRLRRLDKDSVSSYKNYLNNFNFNIDDMREIAINENRRVFTNQKNIENIQRYILNGRLPWEA